MVYLDAYQPIYTSKFIQNPKSDLSLHLVPFTLVESLTVRKRTTRILHNTQWQACVPIYFVAAHPTKGKKVAPALAARGAAAAAPRGVGLGPSTTRTAAAAAAAAVVNASRIICARRGVSSSVHHRVCAMSSERAAPEGAKADTAAAAGDAAAAPQDVKLYVIARTAAALAEFKAAFTPADGYRVSLIDGPPPPGGDDTGGFDAASYAAALRTRRMGQLLLLAPSIDSTQEFMRRHSAVLPEGSVLTAGRQTSGKGRGGNQWTSPDGCLMFTAGRRLSVPGARAPFVNYVVCLAVARGLADAAAPHLGPGAPPPDVRIKWPNDLYTTVSSAAGGAGATADQQQQRVKIGGALIHTTYAGGAFNVLAGVGVNLANRAPTTCLEEIVARQLAAAAAGAASAGAGNGSASAASTGALPDVKIDRGAALAAVVNRLEEAYDVFEAAGFKPLEPEYLQRWLHSGQQVDVDAEAVGAGAGSGSASSAAGAGGGGSDAPPRETARMTIVGLSEGGFLLAADASGARWELSPDGNSFDFFSGLIRRKL